MFEAKVCQILEDTVETNSDNTNRMITITVDFFSTLWQMGPFKSDQIKRLITLTSDYIKQLSLYTILPFNGVNRKGKNPAQLNFSGPEFVYVKFWGNL